MNTPLNDRDLEDYLPRESELSREYRNLSDETLPNELQRAIMKRAQEALEREKREAQLPRPSRWMPPLALAATVVLLCATAFEFGLHHHRLLPGLTGGASDAEDSVTILLDTAEPALRSTPILSPSAQEKHEAAGAPANKREQASPTVPLNPPAITQAPQVQARTESEALMSDAESLQSATSITPKAIRAPQDWLMDIERLSREGKAAEADRELAAFRAAYPQYPMHLGEKVQTK